MLKTDKFLQLKTSNEDQIKKSQWLISNSTRVVEKPFGCVKCPKTFSKEALLKIHERIHVTNVGVPGNVVKTKIASRQDFATIKKSVKRVKQLQQFKHLEKLKSQWFRDVNSPQKTQFRGDKETQPAVKEFHCMTCSKPFSNEEALEVHEKVHDFGRNSQPTVKEFHCNTRNRPFSSEETLKVHEKDHNRVKNPSNVVAIVSLEQAELRNDSHSAEKDGLQFTTDSLDTQDEDNIVMEEIDIKTESVEEIEIEEANKECKPKKTKVKELR